MSFYHHVARIKTILGSTPAEDFTYQELMAVDDTRGLYDDVYVVHYDFEEIGKNLLIGERSKMLILAEHEQAIEEFQTLIKDLRSAGLKTLTTPGPKKSLLVLVKAVGKVLGDEVYRSRYELRSVSKCQ